MTTAPAIHLEPWGPGDLPLLKATLGVPEMMGHLGGPETDEQLADRQARYEQLAEPDRMFKIADDATGEGIGSVGYWERDIGDDVVWETGWFVVPAYQGRGIGAAATAMALDRARADDRHRFVHAYPSEENLPSNAICRKLGFTLLETIDFEYPPGSGNMLRCNDWQLDLFDGSAH
jgi:RimJ/RimL family protein N-acetyltransferase